MADTELAAGTAAEAAPVGNSLSETLIRLLADHLRRIPDDVDWRTASLPDLGLDSMSAIELVIEIEDTFGAQFPPELLVRETFADLGALEAAVRSMTGQP